MLQLEVGSVANWDNRIVQIGFGAVVKQEGNVLCRGCAALTAFSL